MEKRTRLVKVLVTPTEYEGLVERAGIETVSSYCRSVLVNGRDMSQKPEKAEVATVRLGGPGQAFTYDAKRSVAAVATKLGKAPKLCVHGIAKGFNCWQCGGLAAVV
jgi:hypothetical protein